MLSRAGSPCARGDSAGYRFETSRTAYGDALASSSRCRRRRAQINRRGYDRRSGVRRSNRCHTCVRGCMVLVEDDGHAAMPLRSRRSSADAYDGPGLRPRGDRRRTRTSPTACSSTTRSTGSEARTSGTSTSSRRRSRTRPSSCSTRTTGRPSTSSTPPTPSSPTTWAASPRSCGPSPAPARCSSATTPTTRATRRSGWRTRSAASTTRASGGATAPSSTAPTPRAGSWRRPSSRVGIPYKVVGGTRFYDRREIKDALAYLKAAVNPVDEVSVKRVLNVPEAGRRRQLRRPPRRLGHRPRGAVRRGAAVGAGGRRDRPGRSSGIDEFLELLDQLAELRPTGPAPILEAALERSRLPRRAPGRALRRGRGPAREPRRADRLRPASSRRSTSSSSRSGSSPTPTSCPTPRAARSCS